MERLSLGHMEDYWRLLFHFYHTNYDQGHHLLSLPDDSICFPLLNALSLQGHALKLVL